MRRQSLRNAVLMLGGALMCVQTLVIVLERRVRPTSVDPSFYTEVQQAQAQAGTRMFAVSPPGRGFAASTRTP
jgi:hypothetical protein